MLIKLLAAVALSCGLHLAAMAFCARALGLTVRSVTFGLGPVLLRLGIVRLAPLPFGGNLRVAALADYEDAEFAPSSGLLETLDAWQRVLLALCGPLGLLALGTALLGSEAFAVFGRGFGQFLHGAVDPFDTGRRLLHQLATDLPGWSMATTLAMVACKVAAANMIPYNGSNGLQALDAVVPPRLLARQEILRVRGTIVLLLSMLLIGGWLLALLAVA